jgi:hypothetical protein
LTANPPWTLFVKPLKRQMLMFRDVLRALFTRVILPSLPESACSILKFSALDSDFTEVKHKLRDIKADAIKLGETIVAMESFFEGDVFRIGDMLLSDVHRKIQEESVELDIPC